MGRLVLGLFPPPWSVEEYNDACFVVRDNKRAKS